MKKSSKLLITAALLSGATLAQAAGTQVQGSGQVKFHGYIIDAPCSIVNDNPILVDFGQISNRVLANGGKSHVEPFQIELADCDFGESATQGKVQVTFSYQGAATTGSDASLIGFDAGNASGAGVAITAAGTVAGNGTALPVQNLQTGPNTLEFGSYVQGLAGATPTEGEFYANANFTLSYQ